MPDQYRRPGFREAVNAMCKQCIYDPLDHGTWRAQVGNCTAKDVCPLWPLRPLPEGQRHHYEEDE